MPPVGILIPHGHSGGISGQMLVSLQSWFIRNPSQWSSSAQIYSNLLGQKIEVFTEDIKYNTKAQRPGERTIEFMSVCDI